MFRQLFIFLPMLLLSFNVSAEQKKTFGDYDVHYSVLNSTFISPEVAKAYGIVRGKDRALINIAVRQNLDRGMSKAKKSIISGHSSDLIHRTELEFREIIEQEAIYYIAELRFNNKELRTFTIKIQPDPNISPPLKFFRKIPDCRDHAGPGALLNGPDRSLRSRLALEPESTFPDFPVPSDRSSRTE